MRCYQTHPHFALDLRRPIRGSSQKESVTKKTHGENASNKSAICKTERYLPFCPTHLRAIIIESRFQTDKRSHKRNRGRDLLLTRRERERNIARDIQRTLIIREMERVQRRRGAMDRSTKGEEGVDGDGRGGRWRPNSEREQIGIDDVNYDHARRFAVMWISKSKASVPCSFRTVTRHYPLSIPPPPSLMFVHPRMREQNSVFAEWRV